MLAPVFTPLFAVMLVVVTVVYAANRLGSAFDRELLATFDALLVVVIGLVLYGLAARDPARPAAWSDRILLVRVLAALVLDLLVLGSMAVRIGDLGLIPNRVATLEVTWTWLLVLAGIAGGILLAVLAILGDMPMLLLTILGALAGASITVTGLLLVFGSSTGPTSRTRRPRPPWSSAGGGPPSTWP